MIARFLASAELVAVFVRELGLSSVLVARAAFSPRLRTDPAILAVPIDLRTDLAIAVLANLVSLTPGTSSLHVGADRRTLYVHVLDARDEAAVIAGIKTAFEARLKRIEGP